MRHILPHFYPLTIRKDPHRLPGEGLFLAPLTAALGVPALAAGAALGAAPLAAAAAAAGAALLHVFHLPVMPH